MSFKNITKSKICLTTCRECCKFKKDELYFAPVFTKEEYEQVKGRKAKFVLRPRSKNIYQIVLKPSRKGDYFVCPFLNENNQACRIYHDAPFDCRLWPFVLTKKRNNPNVVYLACFESGFCPSLDATPKSEFKKYTAYITKYLKKKGIVEWIKKYPGLVWDKEDDFYLVDELCSLPNSNARTVKRRS